MDSLQIAIFAGSECVARMPPIAALFCPRPHEAFFSITITDKPFCAQKYASGTQLNQHQE